MDERAALGLPPTIEQQQASGRAVMPVPTLSPAQATQPVASPPPASARAGKGGRFGGLGRGVQTASYIIRLIRLGGGVLVGLGVFVAGIFLLVDPGAPPATTETSWAIEQFGPNGNNYLMVLGGLALTVFCSYFFRTTLRNLKARKAAAGSN